MPLFSKKILSPTSITGVWHITENIEDLKSKLDLSPDDISYLEQFKSDERKKHWLSSRVLLNELSGFQTSIIYNDSGKPLLKNSNHHISVSHSGKYSAAIINNISPTGIDIEKQRNSIDRTVDKFLSEKEKNSILSGNHNTEKYHINWGIKESIYKALGKPGIIFKDEINIDDFNYNQSGEATALFHTQKFILHYEKFDNYYLVYIID